MLQQARRARLSSQVGQVLQPQIQFLFLRSPISLSQFAFFFRSQAQAKQIEKLWTLSRHRAQPNQASRSNSRRTERQSLAAIIHFRWSFSSLRDILRHLFFVVSRLATFYYSCALHSPTYRSKTARFLVSFSFSDSLAFCLFFLNFHMPEGLAGSSSKLPTIMTHDTKRIT